MFRLRHLHQAVNQYKHSHAQVGHNALVLLNFRTAVDMVVNNRKNFSSQTKTPHELTVSQDFEAVKHKNKNSYLDMIRIYVNRDIHRRGHVEFIYAALKSMETFDVHKDLEVYKALIDVLPKGKLIPQNIIQAEFMHYPRQQQCAIDLLEQMEDNGVMPDSEMGTILLNTFGKRGHPLRKYWRMMYWMPKFRYLSPWPVPNPPPIDSFELAKLAIARIGSADNQARVTVYQSRDIADAIDDTWIVSSQSPTQRRLLLEHKRDEPVHVDGYYRVWLRNKTVNYFVLNAQAKPPTPVDQDPDDVSNISLSYINFVPPAKTSVANLSSVHEQEDGIILGICATGTSSKDSLLSWIRHLERDGNPTLIDTPVVFTLRTAEKEMATTGATDS